LYLQVSLVSITPSKGHCSPLQNDLPRGSIIAFLPDPKSNDYSNENTLKQWLASKVLGD